MTEKKIQVGDNVEAQKKEMLGGRVFELNSGRLTR